MLNWLQPFSIFCLLDNGNYSIAPHQYDFLVGAGTNAFIEGNDLVKLDKFIDKHNWVFGHLAYDLKRTIHGLHDNKENKIGFAPYFFFSPQIVLELKRDCLHIHALQPDEVFTSIQNQEQSIHENRTPVKTQFSLTREEYIDKIGSIKKHILRGDCYEINFCMEGFAEDVNFAPFAAYQHLLDVSPNPFAAFYRVADKYLLCASPERFLTKKGKFVFSQPIKGTIKRDLINKEHDEQLKQELQHSQKDQSENVMVVDLVRNDLAKICYPPSVEAEELFGIYSYPQVHQMISTISGQLKEGINFSEIIEATFPMGSMTGAPKHRVMQLIDEYETSSRGIFSGSVGYITPEKDFDFNVVIRSIMYNASIKYLSYQVGSGITFYSDPEKEWEECMLKAEAINKVLGSE